MIHQRDSRRDRKPCASDTNSPVLRCYGIVTPPAGWVPQLAITKTAEKPELNMTHVTRPSEKRDSLCEHEGVKPRSHRKRRPWISSGNFELGPPAAAFRHSKVL